MTAPIVLYIAASVDGYIADEAGGVEWLEAFNHNEEDFGYADFMKSVHTLVMGSATYEHVAGFQPYPYVGVPTYVITQRTFASKPDEAITFYAGDLRELVTQLRATSTGTIWLVGGGKLIRSFLQQNLVDEIRLFVMPLLLGAGIALFPDGTPAEKLTMTHHQAYSGGVIELRYTVQPTP